MEFLASCTSYPYCLFLTSQFSYQKGVRSTDIYPYLVRKGPGHSALLSDELLLKHGTRQYQRLFKPRIPMFYPFLGCIGQQPHKVLP